MNDKELRWFIDSIKKGGLGTIDAGTLEVVLTSTLEECLAWRKGSTPVLPEPPPDAWSITTIGALQVGDVIVGSSPGKPGKAATIVGMSKIVNALLARVEGEDNSYVMLPLDAPDVPTWRRDKPGQSPEASEAATLQLVR